MPKALIHRSEDQLLNAQRSQLAGRGLLGHVGSSVHLILCLLNLISKRPFMSHSESLGTCGIWEAVHQHSHGVCSKLQGCRNRAPSHSDSAFRNAEECPNKDTGQAFSTMRALLRSEQMSPQRKHLWLPKLLLILCNKIFSWCCSCSVNSVVLTD